MAVEDAYELAYREAVRALDHQFAALTELRTRAGMLLATASVTVSLLSRETLAEQRLAASAAILCFALLTVCLRSSGRTSTGNSTSTRSPCWRVACLRADGR